MFVVWRSVAAMVICASLGWSSRSFLSGDDAPEAGHGLGGGDNQQSGQETAVGGAQQGIVAGPIQRGCNTDKPQYGYWDLRARLPKGKQASIHFNCTVAFIRQQGTCANKRWAVASVDGRGGAVWVRAAELPIEVTRTGSRAWLCTVHNVPSLNGTVTDPGSEEIGVVSPKQTVASSSVGSIGKIEVYGFLYQAAPPKTRRSWFRLQDLPNMTCGLESYWYTGHWDVQMLVPAGVRAHVHVDCDLISYSGCHYKRWAETVFMGQGETWVEAATIPMSVSNKNWATWICTAWAVTGGVPDERIGSEAPREKLGEVYYNMGTNQVTGNSSRIGGDFTFWAMFKTHSPGR